MPDRNAEARERLRPLEPGERPLGLRLAVALAVLLALLNLVVIAGGWGTSSRRTQGALFAALLIVLAVGMWQRRYLAVLAFELLLGLSMVYATLSLLVASNLLAVLLALAVIAFSAPVFWLLVRVMGRLQAPGREPAP